MSDWRRGQGLVAVEVVLMDFARAKLMDSARAGLMDSARVRLLYLVRVKPDQREEGRDNRDEGGGASDCDEG